MPYIECIQQMHANIYHAHKYITVQCNHPFSTLQHGTLQHQHQLHTLDALSAFQVRAQQNMTSHTYTDTSTYIPYIVSIACLTLYYLHAWPTLETTHCNAYMHHMYTNVILTCITNIRIEALKKCRLWMVV